MALKKTATKKTNREAGVPPKGGKDGGAGGDQPGADSAGGDKEKIAGMLKKAMPDAEPSEEAMQAMQAAHEKALKCGYEGEAAEEAAVAHMKMSHETEESEGEESEAEGESESEEAAAGGDSEDPAADAGAQPSKGGKSTESEIIALKAQNAKLMERFATLDAEAARAKALRESGLGGEALKALGGILRSKKTEAAITEAVKTFKEAYGVAARESVGFIVSAEKTEGGSSGGFSAADCIVGE